MASLISSWKKIKKSGHFKRTLKKTYSRILHSTDDYKPTTNILTCEADLNVHAVMPATYDNPPIEIEDISTELNNWDEYVDRQNADDAKKETVKPLYEMEKKCEIKRRLSIWATSFKINHTALRELFKIWNLAIPNLLPQDPRTFLSTPRVIHLTTLENGTYWHNGLIPNLIRDLKHFPDVNSISLNINIDGLPIYKSSRYEFWPILYNIHEIPEIKPGVIGIYSGTGKPSNLNTYLQNFISEAQQVLQNGLILNNTQGARKIDVKIRCFICDSPARAFLKGVANFNAKEGCLKCTTTGEYSYISHTVYFPRANCDLRTDNGFRNRLYGRHHKNDTPLLQLPIDMVEDFPVGDSLHLIDLGVMKRCLTGWKDGNFGNFKSKWSAKDISEVSKFLGSVKMPSEIHRAVRALDTLAHWKATEYRTFLLYIGIVILKKVLPNDVYQHFLMLFCAITICSSETYLHFLPLAESLLDNYVELYRDFYGEDYMTSNVHNLTHLIHEVKRFGVLSTFNAYPFENRLFFIKNLLRTGNCPLAQVAKRLGEMLDTDRCQISEQEFFKYPKLKYPDELGHSKVIQFENFYLNSNNFKDKWFLTLKNEIVCIAHALSENNSVIIYGYPLINTQGFFEYPIKSSYLNIFKSNGDLGPQKRYLVDNVKCKLVSVLDNDELVFIPLLHTYTTNVKNK